MNKAFYDVKDVMKILNYKKDASYKVIRDLNKELKEKGFVTRQGMINRRYFNERFGIEE